jgi:hypothetical protein
MIRWPKWSGAEFPSIYHSIATHWGVAWCSGQRSAKADARRSEQVSDQKKPPEKGVGEKNTRVFALCGIELNRANQILGNITRNGSKK